MLHGADELLAAEALEGRRVAVAHAGDDRFVYSRRAMLADGLIIKPAVDPANELLESLHAGAVDPLTKLFRKAHDARCTMQT